MRWKQFLTPVKSMNTEQAKEYMAQKSMQDMTILDVRQPNEYEKGHIPGAKLIPLPDLSNRLDEIDSDKDTLIY